MFRMSATIDSRFSFTAQFLMGAAYQAAEAHLIEDEYDARAAKEDPEHVRMVHRTHVVGAIIQAVACLESDTYSVLVHGPGHHLGSGGTNLNARDLFTPRLDELEKMNALQRMKEVAKLMEGTAISLGAPEFEDANDARKLRNEIIHYKSKNNRKRMKENFFLALEKRQFAPPPFCAGAGHIFFPHRCLSAACATWVVRACRRALDEFYRCISTPSPLAAHGARLDALLP